MVRIKKQLNFLIIFCVITSTVLGIALMFTNQNHKSGENIDNIDLKSATYYVGEALDLNDINISETKIYRHFQSVNISVNASRFSPDISNVTLEITSLNDVTSEFNMTKIAGSDIYWYVYSPGYNVSAGFCNVTFQVNNNTLGLLNAHTTAKNFTIKSNCGVLFSESPAEYYLGDLVSADIFASNESITLFDWNTWNVSIDDDMDDTNGLLFDLSSDKADSITFSINDSFTELNKLYYVRIGLNNNSDKNATSFFPFRVLNQNPLIEESSIELNQSIIKRSNTPNCQVIVNASDYESSPAFLNVSLSVIYEGGYIFYPRITMLENKGDGSFEGVFGIDLDMPIGINAYRINLTVSDPNGGSSSSSTKELTVENNAPVIHDYKVNGLSLASGISINYGLDLVFTFNVSDLEMDPAYIKVVLIDSDNNQYTTTQEYETDLEITIRTIDLITGIWYVYVYVIDDDGTMTGIDDDYDFAPVAITVIPDVLSAILPFLALVIGLIIGVAGGIGGTYYRMQSKKTDSKVITPKKTTTSQKKVARQAKSKKGSSKTAEETREKLSKTPDNNKKKEPESEKRTPQRKIKRKL